MRNNMKCLARVFFAAVVLAVWSATASAANLLSNGSFENGSLWTSPSGYFYEPNTAIPGWRAFAVGGADATYSITNNPAYVSSGSQALLLQRNDAGVGDTAVDLGDPSSLSVPSAANRIYKITADTRTGLSGPGYLEMSLQCYGGSPWGFLGGSGAGFTPTDTFQRTGFTAVTPATTNLVQMRINTAVGGSAAVDNVVFEDATYGVNRLINSGFDNSTASALQWRYFDVAGGNAGALVSGVGVGGSQAFQLTRNNFGGDTGLDINDYKTPVIAGEKLQIAFDAKQVSGSASTRLLFSAAQFNSAQGFLGASLVEASVSPTTSGYTTYHYLVDVPSGATALINPAFRVIDDTGSYLIDNVAVVGVPHTSIAITANPLGGNAASQTDRFEGATVTGSTNILPGSDPRDILGGMFSSVEAGNTLGADLNAGGTWSVSFHTAHSVTISGFNLFLSADGDHSNNRAASAFALFQGNTLIAQGNLDPYFSTYGDDSIKVAVGFDAPVSGQDWKLEITNYNSGGARVNELDAIPEPSTLVLLATGLIGMFVYAWRKRR